MKMNPKIILSIFTLSCMSVLTVSCEKETTEPIAFEDKNNTITTLVSTNVSFSTLKNAVVTADLATTLDGKGPFTVFAPTDEAFVSSGINTSFLASLPKEQLKSILLYHTLAAQIPAVDVPVGPNAKVITASGDSIYVTKNTDGIYVNGIKVLYADIAASNGVIHSISGVLLPPTGNLVQVAAADTAFTFLVAAVVKASSGTTNVADILSNKGTYTLFAPTNTAFRAAGITSIEAINNLDANTLTSILSYHVMEGRIFSSDLSNGLQPSTLNGRRFTISLSAEGASVKGNSNITNAKIIRANLMATNGVIHVVDQVLFDNN